MKFKYIITTLAVLLGSVATCFCQDKFAGQQAEFKLPTRGYSGDAGISVGATFAQGDLVPMGNISTTHGFQFNNRFFLGAGLSTLNTQFLALYATVSGTLRKPSVNRPTYPYITANIGYNVSTWAGERFADQTGLYIEPRFGWSFYSKGGDLRYNTFASVILYQFSLIPQVGVSFQF